MERDQEWLEHQIHDDEYGENKDFSFDLFAQEVPFETVDFDFPNFPKISIQTQTEIPTSTGLALWLGSERLCGYLADNAELVSGKKVLELGKEISCIPSKQEGIIDVYNISNASIPCSLTPEYLLTSGAGVGLCGIIASHLKASHVVLTDGDSSVMTNLRNNIQDNKPSTSNAISSRQLIWGKHLDQFEQFEVILAADCVYMNKSLGPLFETVDKLLKSDGLLIYVNLCASQGPLEMVLEKSSSHGLIWTQPEESVYLFRRRAE
jgi:predicted nicotinamide N-methyase